MMVRAEAGRASRTAAKVVVAKAEEKVAVARAAARAAVGEGGRVAKAAARVVARVAQCPEGGGEGPRAAVG